jgi:tetratricopeptide (TPR) repeat protein
MKTKEVAFTLPLAIAMHEFMFFGGQWRKRLIRLVPILLTIVIIPLTMMTFVSADTSAPEAMGEIDDLTRSLTQDLSRLGYLATEMRVIVTYARLLIFPINQNLDYDYPLSHSFWEPRVIVSFVFLASILGLGVYMLRRSYGGGGDEGRLASRPAARLAAFGVFWFFLTLSVESSLIPLQVIFEHRVYLPSAGAFTSLAAMGFMVIDQADSRGLRRAGAILTVLVIAAFSLAAHERNSVWGSRADLWADAAVKSPRKERPNFNLGCEQQAEDRQDEAIEQFMIALRLKPDHPKAHYNLGVAYQAKEELERAIEHYRTATELDPDYVEAHNNLGNAYRLKAMYDKAIEQYTEALRLDPGLERAHNNLGLIYKTIGRYEEAVVHFRETLRTNPDSAAPHINLGVVFRKMGRTDEAIMHFREALRFEPENAMIHLNLSNAYGLKGMAAEAEYHMGVFRRLRRTDS